MLKSTFTAITSTTDAVLCADPSITGDELQRIKAAIRVALTGKADKADTPTARPLIKRGEVARLLGLSPISVDRFARKGLLRRIRIGNATRASGFTAESVEQLLAGRTATNGDTAETGEV